MASNSARSGGCFLAACILAGTIAGIAMGNPMKGVLAGTGLGVLVAVLLWLADLRRR
jgi:hypothetical protein